LQRLMIGHATDLDLDGSGRILIPPSLREYAGLSRAAMLIGQGNRFELWDETQWNQSCQQWLKADENADPLPPELESVAVGARDGATHAGASARSAGGAR